MPNISETVRLSLLALVMLTLPTVVPAQTRAEITINDTGVQAENLTSSQDGTVYFGSTAKGTIYRAAPGAAQAEPWILAPATDASAEPTIKGNRAEVWVLQEGLKAATGVTVVGGTAFVLVERARGFAVPYRPQ
jgi:hypothetical protein